MNMRKLHFITILATMLICSIVSLAMTTHSATTCDNNNTIIAAIIVNIITIVGIVILTATLFHCLSSDLTHLTSSMHQSQSQSEVQKHHDQTR